MDKKLILVSATISSINSDKIWFYVESIDDYVMLHNGQIHWGTCKKVDKITYTERNGLKEDIIYLKDKAMHDSSILNQYFLTDEEYQEYTTTEWIDEISAKMNTRSNKYRKFLSWCEAHGEVI